MILIEVQPSDKKVTQNAMKCRQGQRTYWRFAWVSSFKPDKCGGVPKISLLLRSSTLSLFPSQHPL